MSKAQEYQSRAAEESATALDITRGLVYLIQSDIFYKIGYTTDLDKRLRSLQTGNPKPLTVAAVVEIDHPARLENELHRMFRSLQVSGEWFRLGDEYVQQCKEYMINAAISESFAQNDAYRSSYLDLSPSIDDYDPSMDEEIDYRWG